MPARILRLYPQPTMEREVQGLYLEHRLDELGSREAPFVYANFVTSLDGRIALIEGDGDTSYVPDSLTSANDWRLFQELEAQADCLVTHGGYLRALAAGRLGNILQVGREGSTDLGAWRRDHGLSDQPAVVVASASLDFPVPDSILAHGQPLYIATGQDADPDRVRHWQDQGFQVLRAGKGAMVQGRPLARALGTLGYTRLYLIAGPLMLETMLRDRCLGRLYMTLSHQVMGGEAFHTVVGGPPLREAGYLRLQSLYYDTMAPHGPGQCFVRFDAIPVR